MRPRKNPIYQIKLSEYLSLKNIFVQAVALNHENEIKYNGHDK